MYDLYKLRQKEQKNKVYLSNLQCQSDISQKIQNVANSYFSDQNSRRVL